MKPRSAYKTIIERIIPQRELPGSADQQWEYMMGVFRDVLEMYPEAGVTVTRCSCKGRPLCGANCQRTLSVTGANETEARALIEKSELAHQYW